jgi:hypothetical protein
LVPTFLKYWNAEVLGNFHVPAFRERGKVVNPVNTATWERGNVDLPTLLPNGNAVISALPKRGNVGSRLGAPAEDRDRIDDAACGSSTRLIATVAAAVRAIGRRPHPEVTPTIFRAVAAILAGLVGGG